jgi:Ca2+/Na+ antiporter
MSTYQQAPTGPHHAAPSVGAVPARPATLTAAVGAAIGSAVLNLLGAILIFASIDDIVRKVIANSPGLGAAPVDPGQVDLASQRADGLKVIFSSLASSTIFWALVLALLASFALRGGRTVRVLSSLILVFSALTAVGLLFAPLPGLVMVTNVLVAVLGLTAVVLFFLPASNAFGQARRAAKR